MEVYSVLLINVDSTFESCIKGIFKTFKEAKNHILDMIEPMIEDQDMSWYRHNGSKTLKNFENDLDHDWQTKPFDIYRIEKHVVIIE